MKNYYKILEVKQNASKKEIRSAFLKLANLHHPDKGGDQVLFLIVREAHDVLSDPSKRKQYDKEFLQYQKSQKDFVDTMNIFKRKKQGFKEYSKSTKKEKTYNNKISKLSLYLSLKEAFNGCDKKVYHKETKNEYILAVPPKTRNKDIITMSTPDGILEASIFHENRKDLYVDNNTIIAVNHIDYLTMLTGGEIHLDILGQKVPFNVKECSQNGYIIPLNEFDFDNYGLKVKLVVDIPNKLSKNEKVILSALKKMHS